MGTWGETECKSKMSTLFSRFVSGQILRGSKQRLLSTTKARAKLPDVQGDGSKINIVPSRWNWEIWKNNIHMPIPDGYLPKEHEYYPHPIRRWFARYVYPTYQEVYEVQLHRDWELDKKRRQQQLREEAKRLMRKDGDYASYYHVPITGSWARVHKAYQEKLRGDMAWSIDPPGHKRGDDK